MIGNEALKVMDCVAVGDLIVEVEESIRELPVCIGLHRINELWECFPTFCYVPYEERGRIFLLFKAASDRTSGKESVKLYEVLPECAGLPVVVIEDGSTALTTEGHEGCRHNRWKRHVSC